MSDDRPIRAIVEIINGTVIIYPVVDSDRDREIILEALRKLDASNKR